MPPEFYYLTTFAYTEILTAKCAEVSAKGAVALLNSLRSLRNSLRSLRLRPYFFRLHVQQLNHRIKKVVKEALRLSAVKKWRVWSTGL